jgi:hypothetical protein
MKGCATTSPQATKTRQFHGERDASRLARSTFAEKLAAVTQPATLLDFRCSTGFRRPGWHALAAPAA